MLAGNTAVIPVKLSTVIEVGWTTVVPSDEAKETVVPAVKPAPLTVTVNGAGIRSL